MKLFGLLSALLLVSICFGQTAFTVSPAPGESYEIALSALGSDSEKMIGKLDKNGYGIINLDEDLSQITTVESDEYPRPISEVFMFCDNLDELFGNHQSIKAFEMGAFDLLKDKTQAGFLILASSQAMFNWILDSETEKATLGSMFEMVYITSDFAYTGECTGTISPDAGEDIKTVYEFNLDLKKGLNFIEYKNEIVREGDIENASTPEKVRVISHQTIPSHAKWFAFYFNEN